MFLHLEKPPSPDDRERAGPFGYFPKGGSVGIRVLICARTDPAIRFSSQVWIWHFDPYGGATHTTGSALYRTYDTFPSSRIPLLGSRRVPAKARIHRLGSRSESGGSVPTSRVRSCIFTLCRRVRADIRPPDRCDRRRCALAGTEIVSLRDAIRAVSPGDWPLLRGLHQSPSRHDSDCPAFHREALDSAREQADRMGKLALT
jgi:hypothetical protein